MYARRVVVTGLGLVTPLGLGVQHNWNSLLKGNVATTSLTDPAYSKLPCKVAAFIPTGNAIGQLNINKHFSSSDLRKMSLPIMYALIATKEALSDANWHPSDEYEKERTGVAVGTGMSFLEDVIEADRLLNERYSSVSPYLIPRVLSNMPAGFISIEYSFLGPNHCVSTACATGAHAIGDAFRFIKYDNADVMVAGGTEASISPLGIAAFCRLRALSTKFNNKPSEASRPFDNDRDGFVMGEGAGILILEEMEHAIRRRANIYCEILGYGLSGDAHHLTAPRRDGKGVQLSMHRAVKEARVNANDISYVNAHATSTPIGDDIEINSIKEFFGQTTEHLFVSSSKGSIGHLLGAAGAVETVYTVLACHYGHIPPTANLKTPGVGDLGRIDLVPKNSRVWPKESRRIALKNSFGFGGTNASLCISSYV